MNWRYCQRLVSTAIVPLLAIGISGDGIETFRLGYEFVRDTLELRRSRLMRRAGLEA